MVLDYLSKGHTYEEARSELGVGISTMKQWKKLLSETGSLQKKPLERAARKFHSEELIAYITVHPAAVLKDVAEQFNGSVSGACDALKRVRITFKKRAFLH